jgi:hypothetical protein
MTEYRNLKSIERMLENDLFERLSKRGKLNKEYKDEKLFKRGPTHEGLVELNKQVLKKHAEYRMCKFNSQREILSAIYYREISTAIANEQETITSVFDEYFERFWLFKCFRKTGNFKFPTSLILIFYRNPLV